MANYMANYMESEMNIPDEALFYIAEQDMIFRDLMEALYGRPSQATINHVLRTNPHVDGDWIRAGQMLIVTPPDTHMFAMLEQQMLIAARHVDAELNKLSQRERELLARHYALLSNLSSYNITRYGWTATRFHHHKKNLERYVAELDALIGIPAEEMQREDVSARQHQLMMQIHHAISGLLSSRLFEQGRKISSIRAKLGLSNNVAVHQWKTQVAPARTIASFKTHYAHMVQGAKSLARAGKMSLALGVQTTHKKQIALFESEGGLASLRSSDFGWSYDDDAYQMIIELAGGRSDVLDCSIASGGHHHPACVRANEPLFSQSYRVSG